MPAKSAKQLRFMEGIAHGMKPKNGIGPSPEVAKEFIDKSSKDKKTIYKKKSKK